MLGRGRVLVEVDGNADARGDLGADLAARARRSPRPSAADRDERNDVHGAHPRVLAPVLRAGRSGARPRRRGRSTAARTPRRRPRRTSGRCGCATRPRRRRAAALPEPPARPPPSPSIARVATLGDVRDALDDRSHASPVRQFIIARREKTIDPAAASRTGMSSAAESYPGNPSLPREVRDKILSTFRHTLNLYKEGKLDDCLIGCDFILKMDPRFIPARQLMEKAKNPSAEWTSPSSRPRRRDARRARSGCVRRARPSPRARRRELQRAGFRRRDRGRRAGPPGPSGQPGRHRDPREGAPERRPPSPRSRSPRQRAIAALDGQPPRRGARPSSSKMQAARRRITRPWRCSSDGWSSPRRPRRAAPPPRARRVRRTRRVRRARHVATGSATRRRDASADRLSRRLPLRSRRRAGARGRRLRPDRPPPANPQPSPASRWPWTRPSSSLSRTARRCRRRPAADRAPPDLWSEALRPRQADLGSLSLEPPRSPRRTSFARPSSADSGARRIAGAVRSRPRQQQEIAVPAQAGRRGGPRRRTASRRSRSGRASS